MKSGLAIGAMALVLAAFSAGCRDREGRVYACACAFLTDFDDGSSSAIEVCAPSDERASDVARGCAQSGSPAPIDRCRCNVLASAPPCRVGECLVK